jgi:hypothetical protein
LILENLFLALKLVDALFFLFGKLFFENMGFFTECIHEIVIHLSEFWFFILFGEFWLTFRVDGHLGFGIFLRFKVELDFLGFLNLGIYSRCGIGLLLSGDCSVCYSCTGHIGFFGLFLLNSDI